jgi:hypothetical protein
MLIALKSTSANSLAKPAEATSYLEAPAGVHTEVSLMTLTEGFLFVSAIILSVGLDQTNNQRRGSILGVVPVPKSWNIPAINVDTESFAEGLSPQRKRNTRQSN